MSGAQRFFKGSMQFLGAGVGPIFKVPCEKVFVLLDDLIDEGAVRRRHGLEISLTVSMTKHFDDIGAMVGRQIQQHALAPEALAQFADQAG